MAWTASESLTIYTGPYLVGIGASASETSIGEIGDLAVSFGVTMEQHMAGAFFGSETVYDEVPKGINAWATCRFKQVFNTTLLDKWAILADLSAGTTNKSLTFDLASWIGKSMRASGARVRFHKKSVASLIDETQDIIFPLATPYPVPDEINLMASPEGLGVPIMIRAYPDSNDEVIVLGQNVA
jgi:hypothetical protein